LLKKERVDYWLGVGAKPSEKVSVLIKKYGSGGTHVDAQRIALERMAQPAPIPDPGEPASLPRPRREKQAAETAEASAPPAESAEAPSQSEEQ
jgi:small subunit ribosomal protein S16